jgi:hypothetical protein
LQDQLDQQVHKVQQDLTVLLAQQVQQAQQVLLQTLQVLQVRKDQQVRPVRLAQLAQQELPRQLLVQQAHKAQQV